MIFGDAAAYWLTRYIQAARPCLIAQGIGANCKGTSCLFVPPAPGLAMNYMCLWRMVRRHAHRAGLPLLTPHAFRHAFATHCKDGGMDLITLQILLGHAHLSTTTIYLRTSLVRLRLFLERYHPRGALYQAFMRCERSRIGGQK